MSSKVLRGGKEKKEEEEAGNGGKTVASGASPAPCRHPGITGLFRGLPEKGGLELSPTGIRVLCQEEVISLQSSAQAEALRPNSCVQDRGIRKTGRIGRAKERTERGEGRGQ